MQPTTTPSGAAHAIVNDGTEYFLSALDFTGETDDRIALWAMTNTVSLSDPTPDLAMHVTVLDSLTYGQPPAVLQKDGPTPLRDLLFTDLAVQLGTRDGEVARAPLRAELERRSDEPDHLPRVGRCGVL